ncbi:hypothetical protein [Nocardia harenae]|uniref:hypothetical protein n=1 Tax=Nocardia harenae TaxID=358707 RepID=UPI00082DC706|nr:hypothetical protein [Nocardia harenae]
MKAVTACAALAAGAALALTGCSAGQISQTADQKAAINGNHAEVGQLSLLNVHIVYPKETQTLQAGGSATLALSIVNNSSTVTDELTSITTDLGPVRITPPAGQSRVVIGPSGTVVAAGEVAAAEEAHSPGGHGGAASSTTEAPTTTPAPSGTAVPGLDTEGAPALGTDPEAKPAKIEITGLTRPIAPGLTYNVSFNFRENGTVQVSVPVDAGLSVDRHLSELSGPAAEGSGGH